MPASESVPPPKYTGLSQLEAAAKLVAFGLNNVETKETGTLKIFLSQFLSPLIYLLIMAAAISFYVGDFTGGNIVVIIIIINSVLGFIQEYRSKVAYEKLRTFITSTVCVIRDSEQQGIDKKLLVPGDLTVYKLGDIVAADAFVLEADDLLVDESTLTGESNSVYKQVNKDEHPGMSAGILYSGSYITKGTAIAKVFATGSKSKFGEISNLTLNTKKETEYETNLRSLTRGFLVVSVISLLFILAAHMLLNKSDSYSTILLFTIAIAITIIPEALPVITTLALARTALKLGKAGVIVKRPSSIEDLGNIDLICTDKTGTITQNDLHVKHSLSANQEALFKYAHMATVGGSDPIDKGIAVFTIKHHAAEPIGTNFDDVPFDPVKKYSARKFPDFTIYKGAPEYILSVSQTHHDQGHALSEIEAFSLQGFRAISFAIQHNSDEQPDYLGTFLLMDAIKHDAREVIAKAEQHRIGIKIITGDSAAVATYVGESVGLVKDGSQVIAAEDLHFDDAELFASEVEQYQIFARANPVQKYKIITALEKKHHVGFLGDGINDAPSLKLANVGMVVDTASDIAKATADIILLTKNLDVIIEGVIEGRKVFENIDKYLKHDLTGNFGNFFTIGLMSLFLDFLPMLPLQILLSNLLVDIPSLAFVVDTVDHDQLTKPENHNIAALLRFSVVLGLISSLYDLLFFVLFKNSNPYITQTEWFVLSTIMEFWVIFSIRSKKFVLKASKPASLLIILSAVSGAFVIIASVVGVNFLSIAQLSVTSLGLILLLSFSYFLSTEAIKLLFYGKSKI